MLDVFPILSETNHRFMYALHRDKLFSLFEDKTGIVYVQGAEVFYRHGTDYEYPFRQESNFWYLSGVNEPECSLILDLAKEEFHLFVPKRDTSYAVWHGFVKSREQYLNDYSPDHLHYSNDVLSVIRSLDPGTIYCLNDEQAEFLEDLDRSLNTDTDTLKDAITYCRVLKTDWELDQMRSASVINSDAYNTMMARVEPGMFEYELKGIFTEVQHRHGLLQDAYNGIFAAGKNSAVLHYVENNAQIEDGDLVLVDAGFECNGYASDFSRTFPANGAFNKQQAGIYTAVLEAQKAVIEAIKPGVKMEDLHMQVARLMMQGLLDEGYLTGSLDDIMQENIFALFFPHGLGHFLGLDTHDVGGYPKGVDRIDRPGIQFLRARRELQPAMVVTIEPGIYIIPALLKPAFEHEKQASFLNKAKLEDILDFGGIRIEDDIVVTETGYENLTDVPKEIDEIEHLMEG